MEESEKNKESLTEKEVYSVLEFASYLYNPLGEGYNVYTPEILYNNLLNLNVLPQKTNYEQILSALENAKENAKNIQGYSQFLENISMTYKRTLEYYTNLLSFDMYFTVREAKNMKQSEWKSSDFKSDLNRLYRFMDNFEYKKEFKEIVLNMLRRETVHTWFRRKNTDSQNAKYTLQKMPQDRYIMTGYWEHGILSDFDMQYFLQPGVDIDAYDPKFKELFNQAFLDIDAQQNYIPTNPLNKRDGSFATWVQLSPDDGDWTFKFDTSTFENTPFLTPFLKDCLYAQDVQKLQMDKNMLSAMALLVGEIDTLDKQKSGETQDATAFTPKVLGQFMNLARQALNNNKIKIAALPLVEAEWRQYKDDNSTMYDDAAKSVGGLGASASRIIYSSDKVSQAELEAQILADYEIVRKVYSQFSEFFTFWANKKMRKYHFDIVFDGCTQNFERQDRIDHMLEYADRGIVLNESYMASCIGIQPNYFSRMLVEGNKGGLVDLLTPLKSIYTSSGDNISNKKGRPRQRKVKGESREYDNSNE